MKKFIIAVILAISMVAVCSCKSETPDVDYDLELSGYVADTTTFFGSNFDARVHNVPVENCIGHEVFDVQHAVIFTPSVSKDLKLEGIDIDAWLDSYIKIIRKTSPANANYSIHIKGLVKEKVTGITLSIDKTWNSPM